MSGSKNRKCSVNSVKGELDGKVRGEPVADAVGIDTQSVVDKFVRMYAEGDTSGKPENQLPIGSERQRNEETKLSAAPAQPIGTGMPRNPTKRLQKKSASSSELVQKGGKKEDENVKQRSESGSQHQVSVHSNLTRNSSQSSLSSRMSGMNITDLQPTSPNGSQRVHVAGQHNNRNAQSRPSSFGRASNHWQQQHGVSNVNKHQNNGRQINRNNPQQAQNPNYSPNNNGPNFQFPPQRVFNENSSPTGVFQPHAFPPLPHPGSCGNSYPGPHNSGPNSPGPMVQPSNLNFPPQVPPNIRNGPPPNFGNVVPPSKFGNGPLQQKMGNEFHYGQIVLNEGPQNFENSLANYGTHPNLSGAKPKFQNDARIDQPGQQHFSGKKIRNVNNSEGQNQKRNGNKNWKKFNIQPSLHPKGKRQPFQVTSQGEDYGHIAPGSGMAGPVHLIGNQGQQPYYNNPEVYVSRPNFVPVPNSVPPPMMSPVNGAHYQPMMSPVTTAQYQPMMSPVTTAQYQPVQFVDEQQYTVAFYQGQNVTGNYVAHPQWVGVPASEGHQGTFVPYTSAELQYSGVVPNLSVVPYTVPNVVPAMVPYTAAPIPCTVPPNMIPYTAAPASPQGFVHNMTPPPNAQVLSFTVSSRVGPYTASSEAPKAQFNLSQLERAWEGEKPQTRNSPDERNLTSSKFQNQYSPVKLDSHHKTKDAVQCTEIVNTSELTTISSSEKNEVAASRNAADSKRDIASGMVWFPEKLKKMLDVSSLEKIQRMSSANGKRVPMNSRNKESPNHMPTAPPDVQEEVIKFICDSWNKVYQEYQKGSTAVAYHSDDPCPLPEGFVPFDLEAYWGQRLVQSRTSQNIPTQNM